MQRSVAFGLFCRAFLLYVATSMIVAVVLWFVVLQDYVAELETERGTEVSLRADYQKNS